MISVRAHSLTAESRDAYSVYSMPSAQTTLRRPVSIDKLSLFLGIDVLNAISINKINRRIQ
jgi:hypothetical protein